MSAILSIKGYLRAQEKYFSGLLKAVNQLSELFRAKEEVASDLCLIVSEKTKSLPEGIVFTAFDKWFVDFLGEQAEKGYPTVTQDFSVYCQLAIEQVRQLLKGVLALEISDNQDVDVYSKYCEAIEAGGISNDNFVEWFLDHVAKFLEEHFAKEKQFGQLAIALDTLNNKNLSSREKVSNLSILIRAYDLFCIRHEERKTYPLGSPEYMVKLETLNFDPSYDYEDDAFEGDMRRTYARIVRHKGGEKEIHHLGHLDALKGALEKTIGASSQLVNDFTAREIFQWVCALSGQKRLSRGQYSIHAASRVFASQFMGSPGARLTPMLLVHVGTDRSEVTIEMRYIAEDCRLLEPDACVSLSVDDLGASEISRGEHGVDEDKERFVASFSQFFNVKKISENDYKLGMRFECADATKSQVFHRKLKEAGLAETASVAQAAFNGDIDLMCSLVMDRGLDVNQAIGAGHLGGQEAPQLRDFLKSKMQKKFHLFKRDVLEIDEGKFETALKSYMKDSHVDVDGLTPLHLAVIGNHLEAVKMCVILGAHMHLFNDGTFHTTAYHMAVERYGEKSDMAQFLRNELLKQRAYLRVMDGVKSDFGVGVSYKMDQHVVQGALATQSYVLNEDALIFETIDAIKSSDEFPYQSMIVSVAQLLENSDKKITEALGSLGVSIESSNSTIECDVMGEGVISVKNHVLINAMSLKATRASLMPGVNYVAESKGPLAVYTLERVLKFNSKGELLTSNDATSLLDLTEVGFFNEMQSISLLAPKHAKLGGYLSASPYALMPTPKEILGSGSSSPGLVPR